MVACFGRRWTLGRGRRSGEDGSLNGRRGPRGAVMLEGAVARLDGSVGGGLMWSLMAVLDGLERMALGAEKGPGSANGSCTSEGGGPA
jgi:hypothetical protein